MDATVTDVIGMVGVGGVLLAYFNIQSERWNTKQLAYPMTNFLCSFLILASLWRTPNIPSIVIECVWIAISLYGIWKVLRSTRQH
jgi:paired small multidrug resistance pump